MLPLSKKVFMKSRQNQRGQAFVESGLIMLVFLPVLIGINDPAGSANGATPLLPNLQTADSAKDGYVTASLTSPGTDDARIRVTITNYPYNFLMMPTSLNRRTITDTEPYEIGR
jgi:hypothetical protein